MEELFHSEINVLCIAILLIVLIKSSDSIHNKSIKNKVFLVSILFAVLVNVIDISAKFLSAKQIVSQGLFCILDFFYFASFACFACSWFIYSEIVRNQTILSNKKRCILYILPLVLLLLLLILSWFNGCIFYFDENQAYHRGTLFCLQPIISYGYIFISAVKSLFTVLHKAYFARRNELLTLSTATFIIAFCGILQFIVADFPILVVGMSISILIIYINSLKLMISLDPLTGIPNRREFLINLSDEIRSIKQTEELHFIFIDVDCFYNINDTYGHNEGDKILKELADAIKDFCKETKGYCARYGGDEFAIIQVLNKNADINDICDDIENRISSLHINGNDKQPVHVSIGYTKYMGSSDSIQDLIYRADNAMYQTKKLRRNK